MLSAFLKVVVVESVLDLWLNLSFCLTVIISTKLDRRKSTNNPSHLYALHLFLLIRHSHSFIIYNIQSPLIRILLVPYRLIQLSKILNQL